MNKHLMSPEMSMVLRQMWTLEIGVSIESKTEFQNIL